MAVPPANKPTRVCFPFFTPRRPCHRQAVNSTRHSQVMARICIRKREKRFAFLNYGTQGSGSGLRHVDLVRGARGPAVTGIRPGASRGPAGGQAGDTPKLRASTTVSPHLPSPQGCGPTRADGQHDKPTLFAIRSRICTLLFAILSCSSGPV